MFLAFIEDWRKRIVQEFADTNSIQVLSWVSFFFPLTGEEIESCLAVPVPLKSCSKIRGWVRARSKIKMCTFVLSCTASVWDSVILLHVGICLSVIFVLLASSENTRNWWIEMIYFSLEKLDTVCFILCFLKHSC